MKCNLFEIYLFVGSSITKKLFALLRKNIDYLFSKSESLVQFQNK